MIVQTNVMYSEISVEIRAYELCFAYPDKGGINSCDDLEIWEMRDRGNRRLYFCDDEEQAKYRSQHPEAWT